MQTATSENTFMNNKTAVQMLIESLEYWNINIECKNLFNAICQQALELEKHNIVDAFNEGYRYDNYILKNGNEYYNEKYKK